MTKHYCDVCGEEVTGLALKVRPVLAVSTTDWSTDRSPDNPTDVVTLQVGRALDSTWNAGHLCSTCLGEVLRRASDFFTYGRAVGTEAVAGQ